MEAELALALRVEFRLLRCLRERLAEIAEVKRPSRLGTGLFGSWRNGALGPGTFGRAQPLSVGASHRGAGRKCRALGHIKGWRLEETASRRLVVDGGKWDDSRNERRGGGDELVINPLLLAVAAWSSMGGRRKGR